MIDFDHDTLVALSKSFGLIYLMVLLFGVVVYACWPSNKKRFDRAARSVLDDEDGPWR
ncbi:MAG: cbb3-type cytochrome c oxidase subunit 3 [Kiloniellaceae bacterium]